MNKKYKIRFRDSKGRFISGSKTGPITLKDKSGKPVITYANGGSLNSFQSLLNHDVPQKTKKYCMYKTKTAIYRAIHQIKMSIETIIDDGYGVGQENNKRYVEIMRQALLKYLSKPYDEKTQDFNKSNAYFEYCAAMKKAHDEQPKTVREQY